MLSRLKEKLLHLPALSRQQVFENVAAVNAGWRGEEEVTL